MTDRFLPQGLKRSVIIYKWGYDISQEILGRGSVYRERERRPSKIFLFQCYVVLWIHVIDAICTST